jgi:hypothetical protein
MVDQLCRQITGYSELGDRVGDQSIFEFHTDLIKRGKQR